MAAHWHDDPEERARFETALGKIDDANARDPNRIGADGTGRPRELVYSEWVSDWVLRLRPDASTALRLAARCQHIRRWEVPRNSYEMTRAGYLKWREDLKKFHAETAAAILRDAGFDESLVARVRELNLKRDLKTDPECQTLEDALCLVTLEHQLSELMEKVEEEKLIGVLQKTWKKMSDAGRAAALGIAFTEKEKAIVLRAIQGSPQ